MTMGPFQEIRGGCLLDCTPFEVPPGRYRAQLVIMRIDGDATTEMLLSIRPDVAHFGSAHEAAEFALRLGERWLNEWDGAWA